MYDQLRHLNLLIGDSYPKPAEGVPFSPVQFFQDYLANQPPQPDGMRFDSAHHFSQPQIHVFHTPTTGSYENPAVGVPLPVGQPFLGSAANQLTHNDGMGYNSAPYLHQPQAQGFPAYGAHQTTAQGFPAYGAQQPPAPLPRKRRGLCSFFRNFLDVIRCFNTMEDCNRLNGDCCTGLCDD